jgi:MFS family permease
MPTPDDDASPDGRGREWLTPNVRTLSAVSFLQDAASEMLYPILPIFLTSVLGAPVAVVGVIEGLAEGAAALTKLLAGRLADRRRKKPLIGLGYGLAAVAKALIAVAFAWPLVLVARVLDRFGKGIRGAPRDALLVAGVPVAERGRVFGLHRAADTAGAVIGPLVGLAVFELLGHRFRPLLVLAVVPAVLSVVLVRAIAEPAFTPVPAAPGERPPLPGELRRLVVLLGVFGLLNFPDALLLLRAHTIGLSTGGVVAAYVVYNGCYAAASYPAGALADRLPRHLVFASGLVFFAVGYLGLAAIHTPALVFVGLPLYGGFAACTDGVGKAWVSSMAAPALQGHAQGTYQAVTGFAIVVAGAWAGFAWHGTGRLPLVISGAGALVVAAVVLLGGSREGFLSPARALHR